MQKQLIDCFYFNVFSRMIISLRKLVVCARSEMKSMAFHFTHSLDNKNKPRDIRYLRALCYQVGVSLP